MHHPAARRGQLDRASTSPATSDQVRSSGAIALPCAPSYVRRVVIHLNYRPGPPLTRFIHHCWDAGLRPRAELAVPDGCLELLINLGPSHGLVDPQTGGVQVFHRAWLSGERSGPILLDTRHATLPLYLILHAVWDFSLAWGLVDSGWHLVEEGVVGVVLALTMLPKTPSTG